ncbi:glycosyltransferase [Reyranella sp. CPCC 100927]|uniref:glycosyltransferase n=1 Tax=Reyranella sp. CPCC 100927 TaxID=2599616 RepID=UPI0011B45554|nr:glycosyltransferase [Reyranella sp. CPCC 100927]TWT11709.1 glycosyltransferase [Reyranella sp. CPCC 100927]
MTLRVFIGYDSREAIAFDVCRFSLLQRSTIPLHVEALRQADLRERGLYGRRLVERDGVMVDEQDGRPFSTEFAFTRFLVPALCQHDGWALFCDCDFLFLADVADLLPLIDDSKAVLVCQQAHVPGDGTKMDGCVQQSYRRKNWSSFMLLNCGHPGMRRLTVAAVNKAPGAWLHGFEWLRDDEIGGLPPAWNWIDGVTGGTPRAVHYTAGGPWFADHESVAFAREWQEERARAGAGQITAQQEEAA